MKKGDWLRATGRSCRTFALVRSACPDYSTHFKARRPKLPLRNGDIDDEKASASSGSSVCDQRRCRLQHVWLGFVLGILAPQPRMHRLQAVRIVRHMRVVRVLRRGWLLHWRGGRKRVARPRRRNLRLRSRQISRWDRKLPQCRSGRSRHPERDRPAGVLGRRLQAEGYRLQDEGVAAAFRRPLVFDPEAQTRRARPVTFSL